MLSPFIGHALIPFNLVPRVLQKIKNEKTEGILIVPIFVNQSWFTRLLTLLVKESLWLPSSDISLTLPYRRKSIPYLPKTRLMVFYVSGDACKNRKVKVSESANIYVRSWRPWTSRKYDVYISRRVQFCYERNFSPMKQL